MIRIVHLISGLNVGGAERDLGKLVQGSDGSRFQHVVVSMIEPGPVGKELAADGVEVHELGMRPGRPSPGGVLRLVKILRRIRPDVLHCWMYHANLLGLLAGKLAGVPHIVWGILCSDVDLGRYRPLTRWVVWLCARLSRLATIIIVNSQAGKKIHQAWGYDASKMVVIPNGFDVERFKPDAAARRSVRVELGVAKDTLLIGLIARFDPMKDHATFLKAAGLLCRSNPSVHFLLAGAGITQDNVAIREMVSENCLEGFVHLLGLREDIPRLTAALDIACLSSTGEGFPNVMGEAMACGVPCVVTAVGDAAYIVGDTGRVVPARIPEAMSAAWAELIEMGPTARHALGERARQRVEENFSLDNFVRRHIGWYEALISPSRN